MGHVDYDRWARYVHQCIQTHARALRGEAGETRPLSVLELGGGTGSLACRLQPLGGYRYVLTDGSPAMLKEARRKIAEQTSGVSAAQVTCAQATFPEVDAPEVMQHAPYDAIVLVYDGLNYLTDPGDISSCFARVHELLQTGGIAVIDHSTPSNSKDHAAEFTDRGTVNGVSYVRHNRYDEAKDLHYTTFHIVRGGRQEREEHVQRPYSIEEVEACVQESPLHDVAAYSGFTFDSADARSYRVHWVLERASGE